MILDSGPKSEINLVWLPIQGLPEALVVRPAIGRAGRRRFAQVKALTPAEYAAAQLIAALVQK